MLRYALKGATNITANNVFYQYDAQSETFLEHNITGSHFESETKRQLMEYSHTKSSTKKKVKECVFSSENHATML
jgi:hypothetical protein